MKDGMDAIENTGALTNCGPSVSHTSLRYAMAGLVGHNASTIVACLNGDKCPNGWGNLQDSDPSQTIGRHFSG